MSLREKLCELQDHAALRRAAARQLEQMVARKNELVALAPLLRGDEVTHSQKERFFLFKKQLDDRQIDLAEVLDLHGLCARQMLVVAREFVRV